MLPGFAQFFDQAAPLPYDAEVEYLESTGTQWIDTGVYPTLTTVSRFRIMPLENSGLSLYGILESDDENDYRFFNLEGRAWFDAFGTRAETSNNVRPFPYGSWYEIELGNHYIKNLETGIIVCSEPTATSAAHIPNYHMTLNHAVWGGTATNSKSRWSYVTILENDLAVRDFISVRFTNSNNQSEGAMYDRRGVGGMNPDGSPRTDGLYRNRGTGAFLYGPDKS